jgi:hypothetical protein
VLTVTNGNNGGTATFNMDTGADLVELTVTITNPCESTTIEDITFTTAPLVVINGETGFTEWTMPVTALDTAKVDTDLCGDVSFEVLLDGVAVVWASTSNQGSNTWRLNIDTREDLTLLGDLTEKDYAMTLVGTLDEYSTFVTRDFAFTVTITETVCDCELLLWNNPAAVTDLTVFVGIDAGDITIPMPVPDTATNALDPQFEKCYHNSGTCAEDG